VIDAAVVGLGWWGKVLVQSLQGSSKMRIVRGVTPHPEAAQEFARAHAFPVTAQYTDVLRDRAVQAVILATPHSVHEEQVVLAARHGKHVFVEKPLALTRDGAVRAVQACNEAGVVLGQGLERRFEPPMVELRKLAGSGALGTLLQIEANFSHDRFLALARDNWRLSPKEAPAGGMTATGIHLLDLAVSLLGPAQEVHAESRALASDLPAGDSLAVLVRFRTGATAYISVMLATPFISRFALFGSKGWIELRDKAHPAAPEGWIMTRCMQGGKPETIECPVAQPVRANLEAFADAVAGGADYPIKHDEMIATVCALEAIVRSAERGTLVTVA
jgi:predicted dehydrogenase